MTQRRKTMVEGTSNTGDSAETNRPMTMLEKIEAGSAELSPSKESSDDCQAYCPTGRPPIGVLTVLDDASGTEGEEVRIRDDRTIIGREIGDIVIPHDHQMSSRHAEILRQLDGGRYRWFLHDLGSTNGTFVRVSRAQLRHDHVIMIGSRRYRFRVPTQGVASGAAQPSPPRNVTMGWKVVSSEEVQSAYPSLVEEDPLGDGSTYPLTSDIVRVGSDPARCTMLIENDPFVSRHHATITRSGNQWQIENNRSTNGLWMRIDRLPMDSNCQFQLGEQRFVFRPGN